MSFAALDVVCLVALAVLLVGLGTHVLCFAEFLFLDYQSHNSKDERMRNIHMNNEIY